ncbi:MAG: pyridoxamine 5-phosphate oxidase family protein [Ilumatobacteraceae bacterium]|nr:pyridoxamine 5-phosphate oxidase family protein [Ilumatobacteraceae bacterium]MCU1387289.1 pyridoxamine 5-phosphate oxidase family protein [Ilumatobacteraceae bacterium]
MGQPERMELDLDGMRTLSLDECAELLTTTRLGRVALSEKALPTIVAEAYAVRGSVITFLAPCGLLAAAARRGDIVCFEADSAEAAEGEFWSVVVIGKLQLRRTSPDFAEQRHLDSARDVVALPMTVVTGHAAAATIVHSTTEGRDHDGLDRVEAVLGLVEDDRAR